MRTTRKMAHTCRAKCGWVGGEGLADLRREGGAPHMSKSRHMRCEAHARTRRRRSGHMPLQVLVVPCTAGKAQTYNGARRAGNLVKRTRPQTCQLVSRRRLPTCFLPVAIRRLRAFGGGVQVRSPRKASCARHPPRPWSGDAEPSGAASVAPKCDAERPATPTCPLNELKQCALQAESRSFTLARSSLKFRSKNRTLPSGASSSI